MTPSMRSLVRSLRKDLGPQFFLPPAMPLGGGFRPFGRFARRILDPKGKVLVPWESFDNGSTYLGLNYLLNTGFRGTSPSSSWFCGLIADGGSVALSPNDTSASHAGWTELTTYASATRPAWSPSAASSGLLNLASAISYVSSGTSNIRGAFLANSSTKSSTTDLIYSTAIKATADTVTGGNTYQLFYFAGVTPSS